ncbi:MAG: sulfatase-like hydrolase/transferase [Gemmataceae bacterium]
MTRWLLTPVLTVLCFLPALPAREQKKRPPNLVIVLADDMGIGDAGCYNPQSRIATPYLDKLAAQGRRFSDMHSPSAVCSPTRYGLLTGRIPPRV